MQDYRSDAQCPYVDCSTSEIFYDDITAAGAFPLGNRTVKRMGYGAMQLRRVRGIWSAKDRDAALASSARGVASGVDHIDTSDFYGPHITNGLIREALHPYPDDLVIVTKVGAVRGDDASWIPRLRPQISPAPSTTTFEPGRRRTGRRQLSFIGPGHGPSEGSIEEHSPRSAELQRQV